MSWISARASAVVGVGAAARAHRVVVLALVLLTFLQRPGRTTFDTKFDLTADPGGFLGKTLHLWNPELSFGELQNQAYGYLFPQGAFFLAGDLAGLPDWIVQRLWSALILVAAYEGARRLMRAWASPASPWVPLVAGLAYALAPRLLGLSGVLTAEVLPTAVLPWVLLPVVLALRGRISARLGGLLSGVAVLFMGGVNAVENLAALPLPALVLLFALGSADGRRLALWWSGAVALACSWWMLPLLVLGKYSPPFLDYIETSTATTHPLGWVNATRGADHWLAFINIGGQPWWPGAFALATEPVLIGLTVLVATLSLAGLFHPSMPGRAPLALSVLLGLVLLTIAHVAPWSSPLSEVVRELLDGVLAPLRNVHKVDPIIRLPLALGLAHGTGLLLTRSRARSAWRPWLVRVFRPAALVVVLGLLLGSAQPLFDRDLRKEGWESVPGAWYEATDYLAEVADGRRALVLPGSGFGQQTWGWTIDEPIQGLARSPWVTRSQVPLVPGPTIRFLDSLEDRIQDGRGSAAFADVLARSGIGYVVVRRDLDLLASGAPSPSRVDQAIALSPGLDAVADFGSAGAGLGPAITIYAVRRDVPRVEAVLTAEVTRLAGGSEDVLTLLEAGALRATEPVLVSTDEPDLIADGYRLRERQFGRLRDSQSQLMTPAESYRNDRKAHDYPGVPGVERVHAVYPEISALDASSSSGFADTLGAVRPELGPYAAVDGVLGTFWRSAPLEDPQGQWLEVTLKRPQPLTHLDVTVGVDIFSGVPVRRVRVAAGDQVSDHAVDPATGVLRVPLNGSPVDRVRVTVLSTLGDPEYGVVAIREIAFPGLELGRSLAVPAVGTAGTDFVFRAQAERRACVGSLLGRVCEPDEARPSEEEAGLVRTFSTDQGGQWALSGTVVARSALATGALLHPLGDGVAVTASSVLAEDPSVSGQFAFDGDPGTAWLSSRGAGNPALTLRWGSPRTISRLQVRAATAPSRTPSLAVIEADGVRREVDLGSGSLGFFAPITTDELTVTFPGPDDAVGTELLPVGIGELVLDGLEDLVYAPDREARTGAECGLGPEIQLDSRSLRTRVVGTLGDVLDGTPLRLEPCDAVPRLDAGEHRLSVVATDRFVATTVVLEATSTPSTDDAEEPLARRSTEIRSWESTDRAVYVGPGEEALLRIPENANAGWRATLDGQVLEQATLDGWQQGYVVPAGDGGVVRLVYTPDGPYRWMLLIGGLAALLLLLVTVRVGVRERHRVAGPAAAVPIPLARGLRGGPGGVLFVVLAGVAGGASVLLGTALGVLLRDRPGPARILALGLVATAGIAAAVVAQVDAQASWTIMDAITGGAVGLLFATLLTPRNREA